MDDIQEALLDLMVAIDSPQSVDKLLRSAKVRINRGLVPLLVRIRLRGPISVGELAEQSGRDESTVSHQLRTLEELGLINRRTSAIDVRTRMAVVTEQGGALVEKIGAARDRLVGEALRAWTKRDREELGRLIRRLADSTTASMQRL